MNFVNFFFFRLLVFLTIYLFSSRFCSFIILRKNYKFEEEWELPKHKHSNTLGIKQISWFRQNKLIGLVWFYNISTIVGYLMRNSLYTYILNIYDLVGWGFMAYQPL